MLYKEPFDCIEDFFPHMCKEVAAEFYEIPGLPGRVMRVGTGLSVDDQSMVITCGMFVVKFHPVVVADNWRCEGWMLRSLGRAIDDYQAQAQEYKHLQLKNFDGTNFVSHSRKKRK
jgi:hypothetical protein